MRPAVLVGVVIAIATCCSCSDSDHITLPSGIKGDAGEPGAGAQFGAAGSESSPGGGPTATAGADSAAGSAGAPEPDSAGAAGVGAGPEASGGTTATAGGGGATAGAGTSAGGGTSGNGPDAGEALSFCPRLTTPSLNALNVTRAYDHAVYADCRVTWVTGLYLQAGAREDFLNDLLFWSLQLWGCQPPPVTDFALIYQTAPLTSADAKALIDDYIAVATTELTLSSGESSDMRAALERLSKQTVSQDSADYSHSSCISAAGTAGVGGSSGTAGVGGTAGSGAGTGGASL